MKTFLLSLVFACRLVSGYSQQISETDKLASLCRIWGMLKYFHPAVAQGKMNWDEVFISEVDSLAHINDKDALNAHYCRWVSGLGDIKSYLAETTDFDKTCNFNSSLKWIDSGSAFTPQLTALLKDVVVHRCTEHNRFVRPQTKFVAAAEFTNEEEYPDLVYPAKEYRMLTLARYWNMIEYFYPYKYLTDKPWDAVLTEFIPALLDAPDTASYVRALSRLVGTENDSHSNLPIPAGLRAGVYYLPVVLKVFPDKALVTEIVNDSLAKKDDLQPGDVLLSINDTSISDLIRYKRPYVGASNESVVRRNLKYMISAGRSSTATVRFDRNGVVATKQMDRFPPGQIGFNKPKEQDGPSYKSLSDGIGYADMARLKKTDIKPMFKTFSEDKAVILDMRNYPNFIVYDLCNYLAAEKTPFVQFLAPDYSFPGKFVKDELSEYGQKQDARFKGRIIILVNENTQSRGEFTTMALRALPNSTVIGSQTAGADGNAVDVVLPGGYKFIISGLGVYYPDGRETQRIGIKPDIYAEATVEGLRQGKDEVLGRAISYITSGK